MHIDFMLYLVYNDDMKTIDPSKNEILVKSWCLNNVRQIAKPNQFRLYITLDLDNYNNYDDFMKVIEDVQQIGYRICCTEFYINAKKDMFSTQEIANIKKFEEFLDENATTLFIKEDNALWNILEINKANEFVDDCVKEIKRHNLSPFEEFMYAYKMTTNNVYTSENSTEHSLMSRSIYGVTNSDKIVCVGYATLLKEICNRLNTPGLKCYSSSVNLTKKDSGLYDGSHRLNVVELVDEKYGISGLYHADACWDSIVDNNATMTLNYCLLSFNDVKLLSNVNICPRIEDGCLYLYSDDRPSGVLYNCNAKNLEFIKQLNVIDVDKERKRFANAVLNGMQMSGKSTEEIEKMKKQLDSPTFQKSVIEYTFLRSIVEKIKKNTTPITYQNYVDALTHVCSCEGKNILQTKEYVDKVVSTTKDKSFQQFIPGAKHPFYILSRADFNRRTELRKHFDELRQKRLNKKNNSTKIDE